MAIPDEELRNAQRRREATSTQLNAESPSIVGSPTVLEITWKHVLSLWWSFQWRSFVVGLPLTFGLVTFILATAAPYIRPGSGGDIGERLARIAWLPASLITFRMILFKQFKQFSIQLLCSTKWTPLPITWKQVILIWWRYFWRTSIFFFLFTVLYSLNKNQSRANVEFMAGIVASLGAFQMILRKKFKDFSIQLVNNDKQML